MEAISVACRTPWLLVRKYANLFRVSLTERMVYRGDFLLGTCLRFLPVMTTILLWKAVFASASHQKLAGFDERQMISYLLLIHISRMFSSMPGLAGGISRDVREGTIKKYLTQPLDMIGYLLSYRMAHKTAYILTAGFPYAFLFFLCRSYFDVPRDPMIWIAYLCALVMGFLVGFFFEVSMGMVGFWFLEITSLLWIVNTINFFISGQMFPLDLLPPFWTGILRSLPFQYLAYFPAMVFLGKIQGPELIQGLAIEAVWVVVLIALSRWFFNRGLRRYSAFGG
jgi:ABC-2 type transport system permease protein